MKKRAIVIILIVVTLIIVTGIFFFNQPSKEGILTQDIKVVPLSSEERQQVVVAVISSEFIEDIPKKYPVAITFFSFENGERIFHDSFLIGKQGFLTEGKPEVYLSLHSKYIKELNQENFCEIVQRANKVGDLGFYSESSKVSLLIKYRGMLKYRECIGF